MNCESKWIRIKNKMIRRGESKIKKNFDSSRESKIKKNFWFISRIKIFLWFLIHIGESKIRKSKWFDSVRALAQGANIWEWARSKLAGRPNAWLALGDDFYHKKLIENTVLKCGLLKSCYQESLLRKKNCKFMVKKDILDDFR